MCVDRFFSQRIHSFWLSLSPSGYLSQLGLTPSQCKRLDVWLVFSSFPVPAGFIPTALIPNQHGAEFWESPLCRISLCGTCIPCFARLPGTSFIVYSCCLELVVFFCCCCLFVLHVKSNSFCPERVLSCCWLGKVEHIARQRSCSAQCFEFAKFFSKVWIFNGRKRSFWYI